MTMLFMVVREAIRFTLVQEMILSMVAQEMTF